MNGLKTGVIKASWRKAKGALRVIKGMCVLSPLIKGYPVFHISHSKLLRRKKPLPPTTRKPK